MGPPSLGEKSIFSFWESLFILFMAADKPFRVPRPALLGPPIEPVKKQYVRNDESS